MVIKIDREEAREQIDNLIKQRRYKSTSELIAECTELLKLMEGSPFDRPGINDQLKIDIFMEVLRVVTTKEYEENQFTIRTRQARDLIGLSERDDDVIAFLKEKGKKEGAYRYSNTREELALRHDPRERDVRIVRHEMKIIIDRFIEAIVRFFKGNEIFDLARTLGIEREAASPEQAIDKELSNSPDLHPAYKVSKEDRRTVLEGDGWAQTLSAIYDDQTADNPLSYPLLKFESRTYPIWAELAAEDEWRNLESAVGELGGYYPPSKGYSMPEDPRGPFDEQGREGYWEHHKTRNLRSKHNGPTFSLDRIRRLAPGRFRIDCSPGWYFESTSTSEVLDAEATKVQLTKLDSAIDLNDLPRRRWLHEQLSDHDPVFNGRHRAAAVSIATTMIYALPEEQTERTRAAYRVLMIPRSLEVATHPLFNHVAPSCIFSPLDWPVYPDWLPEFSVRRNIFRELLEELYDYDELEHGKDFAHNLETFPAVNRLLEAERAGTAHFRYCGISENLFTLRPEICTLIFFSDPDWFDKEVTIAGTKNQGKSWRPNWEYLLKENKEDLLEGQQYINWLFLDADFRPINADRHLSPAGLVPNAAAALHLSLEVARRDKSLKK